MAPNRTSSNTRRCHRCIFLPSSQSLLVTFLQMPAASLLWRGSQSHRAGVVYFYTLNSPPHRTTRRQRQYQWCWLNPDGRIGVRELGACLGGLGEGVLQFIRCTNDLLFTQHLSTVGIEWNGWLLMDFYSFLGDLRLGLDCSCYKELGCVLGLPLESNWRVKRVFYWNSTSGDNPKKVRVLLIGFNSSCGRAALGVDRGCKGKVHTTILVQ